MRRLLLTATVLTLAAMPAAGATILLKNGETLRGRVVSKTFTQLVVELTDSNGEKSRRTIPADQVETVLPSVSTDRLAELKPEQPREYQLYAEELAEKRLDPEARETAIRLYLIAAHLDPKGLGRSCLLGMSGLARTDPEARRFRALAYLLDDSHDRRLLESPAAVAAVGPAPIAAARAEALQLIRLLRNGKRQKVQQLLDVESGDAKRKLLESLISADELKSLLSRTCAHCSNGFVKCPLCKGTGNTFNGGVCPRCRVGSRATGKAKCEHCLGRYRDPQLAREQLALLVQLEMKLLGIPMKRTAAAASGGSTEWTGEQATVRPTRSLSLDSVTEFDPRQSVYRNGRWTAP